MVVGKKIFEAGMMKNVLFSDSIVLGDNCYFDCA